MSEESPLNGLEKKEGIDDNARKFTLDVIDSDFLRRQKAISYDLTVDWLITDAASEKKIVHKKLDTGEVQYFLIEKVIEGEKRKTDKKRISEEEYRSHLGSSMLRVEKRRFEFDLTQNNLLFKVKYDEFANSKVRMVEVDADTEADRNAFRPTDFPFKLTEVTGDVRYYGYHVKEVI